MKEWLKAKSAEEEAKSGIPPIEKTAVLYCCPRDYWKHPEKVWRSDIGSLRAEADAIPAWRSVLGRHSPFEGMKFEDIRLAESGVVGGERA